MCCHFTQLTVQLLAPKFMAEILQIFSFQCISCQQCIVSLNILSLRLHLLNLIMIFKGFLSRHYVYKGSSKIKMLKYYIVQSHLGSEVLSYHLLNVNTISRLSKMQTVQHILYITVNRLIRLLNSYRSHCLTSKIRCLRNFISVLEILQCLLS